MKLYLSLGPFFFVNFLGFKQVSAATDKVICYYESWNAWEFTPEDIDLWICTHINYSFLGLNEDGGLRLDESDDLLKRIANLKSINPYLKVLLSVGGWNEGSVIFSNIAADAEKKSNMAYSVLWYLQTFNFDGIDIYWQYPGQRGGTPADKENFIDMLKVLRDVLSANGNYLITTAVSYVPDDTSYNVKAISDVVDGINVMTYNFHSVDGGKTGQNAPLYASSVDNDWERTYDNVGAAIYNWISGGADPAKLIMGLGFFGISFTLADPNNNGIGAPIVGPGTNGGSFAHICTLYDGWTEVWDYEQQVPYKYSGDQWIGFDNPRSIALKVHYTRDHNLGGVMVWTVDQDNKDTYCGLKNALLREVKDNL